MMPRNRTRPFTVREAAEELGLCDHTIRRYLKAGLIRSMVTPSASKFGRRHRIPVAEIDRFRDVHMAGQAQLDGAEIEGVRHTDTAPETEPPKRAGHPPGNGAEPEPDAVLY